MRYNLGLRAVKRVFQAVVFLVLLVVLVSIYKFNFTNGDLFIQNSQGDWVPMDSISKP